MMICHITSARPSMFHVCKCGARFDTRKELMQHIQQRNAYGAYVKDEGGRHRQVIELPKTTAK